MESYARKLRRNATETERLLWWHLRGRQLSGCKFRRQHPIGPYICDFVCLEASVVVELDGSHHAVRASYDATRDAFLKANGFLVLRFWNVDVLSRIDFVVNAIHDALHQPPPPKGR